MRLLSVRMLLAAVMYSAIFPLSNLFGGGVAMAGIFITLPFLPLGWIGGLSLVWLLGTERAFLAGVAISVFCQVVPLMALWSFSRRPRA